MMEADTRCSLILSFWNLLLGDLSMHRIPIAVVVLLLSLTPAIAFASTMAEATAPSMPAKSATPDERAMAETLVTASGEQETQAKALEPMNAMLSAQIARRLSLTDPADVATVKRIVHEALSPAVPKAVGAMVDALAANFSTKELSDVVAFVESPAGRAEKANLPLLKGELAVAQGDSADAAKVGEAAARIFAATSREKRDLVLRILTAQDFENHTRKGYVALQTMFKTMASHISGVLAAGEQPPSEADRRAQAEKEARAADDYVRLMTNVEEGFYVTHYSDGQLRASATYLESEAGQAILARMPIVRRAVGEVWSRQMSIAVSSLPDSVCAALHCSPEQRTIMTDYTNGAAAAISTGVSRRTDSPG